MSYRKNKRDLSESEIVSFWSAVGCLWIPFLPGQGCDGILVDKSGFFYFVEIKTPGPHQARFTPVEERFRDRLQSFGLSYSVVLTVADAARLIGLDLDQEPF